MRAQFRLSDLIPAELTSSQCTTHPMRWSSPHTVIPQVASVPNAVRPPIAFIAAILG